jgi:hypothetical protein
LRPAGLHTHGSDLTELIAAAAVLAAVGAAVEFILSIIWVIAVVFGVTVAGLITLAWYWHRKYGRAPVVLPGQAPRAIPAPQSAPIAAPAAAALPAPREVHYHLHIHEAERQAIDGRGRIEG